MNYRFHLDIIYSLMIYFNGKRKFNIEILFFEIYLNIWELFFFFNIIHYFFFFNFLFSSMITKFY